MILGESSRIGSSNFRANSLHSVETSGLCDSKSLRDIFILLSLFILLLCFQKLTAVLVDTDLKTESRRFNSNSLANLNGSWIGKFLSCL